MSPKFCKLQTPENLDVHLECMINLKFEFADLSWEDQNWHRVIPVFILKTLTSIIGGS